MPNELVLVRWNDAHSGGTEQFEASSVPHAPMIVETVGWLLRQDGEGVSVASELIDGATYRAYTFVPAGMVISVTPVVKPRKKRGRNAETPPDDTPSNLPPTA